MKFIICFLVIIYTSNIYASRRYQIISGSYYITDQLNILSSYNHFSEVYTPKYFPNDYSLKFESKKSFLDFYENSIKIKTIIQNTCYEFVVYSGKVVLQKRFLRKTHCIDKNFKKGTEVTCDILKSQSSFENLDYSVEYLPDGRFVRNCNVQVHYKGQEINILRDEKKNIPQGKSNSSTQNKWYITNLGNLVSLQKNQFKDRYMLEQNEVYFESSESVKHYNNHAYLDPSKSSSWFNGKYCIRKEIYKGFSRLFKTDRDSKCGK